MVSKRKHKFHVCVPLYKGIPKELQSGWVDMGEHGVREWDNTTNLLPYLSLNPKMDTKLYCGTCGRIMVKGRNRSIDKSNSGTRLDLVSGEITHPYVRSADYSHRVE